MLFVVHKQGPPCLFLKSRYIIVSHNMPQKANPVLPNINEHEVSDLYIVSFCNARDNSVHLYSTSLVPRLSLHSLRTMYDL